MRTNLLDNRQADSSMETMDRLSAQKYYATYVFITVVAAAAAVPLLGLKLALAAVGLPVACLAILYVIGQPQVALIVMIVLEVTNAAGVLTHGSSSLRSPL